MKREEITKLKDQSLNGNQIRTTDSDKLMMIDELLKRKGHIKVDVQIIRRWLHERSLTIPNVRCDSTPGVDAG